MFHAVPPFKFKLQVWDEGAGRVLLNHFLFHLIDANFKNLHCFFNRCGVVCIMLKAHRIRLFVLIRSKSFWLIMPIYFGFDILRYLWLWFIEELRLNYFVLIWTISSQLTPWVNWPHERLVNWPPPCESTDPSQVGLRPRGGSADSHGESHHRRGNWREEGRGRRWGQLTIIGSTRGALGAGEQWGQLTFHQWGQMTQGVSWLVTHLDKVNI